MLDLAKVRIEVIAAVADDHTLRRHLVLKGGNALALVHKVGMRTSLDIDYSMPGDLDDPAGFGKTLELALSSRFVRHDLVVFDFSFEARPKLADDGRRWGGYNAEFKLISRAARSTARDLDQMRRQALPIDDDPQARRRFRIEISKFEFCSDQPEMSVADDIVCRVYSLDLA